MRFIAFEKTTIKGKDGREWGVIKGMLDNGSSYEFFTSKAEFDALAFPDDAVLSKDEVKEIFGQYKSAEVQFDQRGKLVTVS